MIIFQLGEDLVFSSPLLLTFLNTLFLTGTGIAVSVISGKSFLQEGGNGLLILGLATAVGGSSALLAGWAASISIDYNIAIYNIGILASGGLQLLSATLASVEVIPREPVSRKMGLIVAYFAGAAFLAAVTCFVVLGFAPVFFTASGPTPTRDWVLGTAFTFFVISTAIFGWQYQRSKSPILYWYTLALALFAIGLLGAALVIKPNTVLNWIIRLTQYLAGFYFLAGLLKTGKAKGTISKYRGISERWADAFRNDRRQLDTLFGTMLNGFAYHRIICDDEGKPVDYAFLDVNTQFEQITGLRKRNVLGRRATEVIPGIEKDPADWIGVYGKVALTQQPVQFENYAEPLNKWFSVSAYSPKKGYFVAIFEDITERRKREEKLREQSLVIDSASDAIFSTDNSLNIRSWNKAAERIFGWKPEEVIGRKSTSIFKTIYPAFNGTTAKEAMEQITQSGFWKGETIYHHKNGSPIPVSVSFSLLKDENGNDAGGVAIAHDITARKRREEVLRKAQHDLKRAQAVAKTGSWRLDVQHNVLLWSDENHRMFGVPKGTPMTYEAFLSKVYPDDRKYVDAMWKAALQGEPYDIEHRIVANGEVKWVREKAELEFDEEGKLLGGFGTTQEITDIVDMRQKLEDTRVQLEEYATQMEDLAEERAGKLKDAERLAAIGATAGMVGHDIRNPLQAILGDLYLLGSDLASMPESDEKEDMKESLASIKKSVDYIDKIVQDLQDYARPIKSIAQKTVLDELCNEVLFKTDLPENINATYWVTEEAAEVTADPELLKRVLNNLVNNAVQAMPEGGKLEIQAYKEADDVVITVQDSGLGIAEEVKPKLFMPLFTTKSKGQGFGLAVVKRMTEALGGTVSFSSEEGKGTNFIVRIPQKG
jgi:PAS domain S-box-containing protein